MKISSKKMKPWLSLAFSFFLFSCYLPSGVAYGDSRPLREQSTLIARINTISPEEIVQRLYATEGLPEITEMAAELMVKRNLSGKQVRDDSSLTEFSRGKLFFKAPYKLRVESTVLLDFLSGEQFIVIRDGRTEWLFKNGVDYPMNKTSDPGTPSSYLPFGFPRFTMSPTKQYTLLSTERTGGTATYVLSLIDKEDPLKKVVTVWVDGEKWLPVKVESTISRNEKVSEYAVVDGEATVVERKKRIGYKLMTVMKEFKKTADGRWFPGKIEYYEKKNSENEPWSLQQVVSFDRIAVNHPVPDTLFAPQLPIPSVFSR